MSLRTNDESTSGVGGIANIPGNKTVQRCRAESLILLYGHLQDNAARRASRSSETGSPSPQHSLPVLDVDTWEIQAADLEICKGPDGKEVKLGSGSFGTVRFYVGLTIWGFGV